MKGCVNSIKKYKVIQIIVLTLLCIVGAIIVELFYFNFYPLFNPSPKVEIKVKAGVVTCNREDVLLTKGNDCFQMIFPESYYYRKINIYFTNKKAQRYEINWTGKDIYGKLTEKSIKDIKQKGYKRGVTNLNDHISEISIKLYGEQRSEISAIKISNSIQINRYRLVWLFSIFLIIIVMAKKRYWFKNKLHWAYVIFSFILCLNYWFIDDIMQSGWDENVHFRNSYQVALGKDARLTKAIQDYIDLPEEIWANTYEEHRMIISYYNKVHQEGTIGESIGRNFRYKDILYLPYIILIKISYQMKLSFYQMYLLAKLGSMICYIILMGYTIKIAKTGKLFLMATGMMPTRLFINSTYNYDSLTVAFLTLGFVLWLNELLEPEKKLSTKKAMIIILTFVLGSIVKQIYIPFVFLLSLFPNRKYTSKKQKKWIIRTFFGAGIMVIILMIGPMLYNYGVGINVAGDYRGGNTSVTQQLSLILEKPWVYIKLLLSQISNNMGEFLLGRFPYTNFAFHRRPDNAFVYITASIMIFLFCVRITDEKKEEIILNFRDKICIMGILVIIVVLIWTALYLSYTPVGLDLINGVQARYYAPLIYPLMCVIKNKYIIIQSHEEKINWIMCNFILLLNIYCIYEVCCRSWTI